MWILIRWLGQKPSDLDFQCFFLIKKKRKENPFSAFYIFILESSVDLDQLASDS